MAARSGQRRLRPRCGREHEVWWVTAGEERPEVWWSVIAHRPDIKTRRGGVRLGGVPGFGCKYALLQNLVVPHAHAHHAGAHPCSHSSLLPSSCVWQEFSDARGSMLRVHRSLLYVENKACFWAQPEQITSG